jgi:hypothetical protein
MTQQVRVGHPSRLLSSLSSPGASPIAAQATAASINRLGYALVYSRAGELSLTPSPHSGFPAEPLKRLQNQKKTKNPK